MSFEIEKIAKSIGGAGNGFEIERIAENVGSGGASGSSSGGNEFVYIDIDISGDPESLDIKPCDIMDASGHLNKTIIMKVTSGEGVYRSFTPLVDIDVAPIGFTLTLTLMDADAVYPSSWEFVAETANDYFAVPQNDSGDDGGK